MSRKREQTKKVNLYKSVFSLILLLFMIGFGYITNQIEQPSNTSNRPKTIQEATNIGSIEEIPEYAGNPYITINENIPYFEETDNTTKSFETYSKWDHLGRSGVAFANISKETMPKKGEERGEIGSIKDLSGWVQKRYDNIIKDKYLYNRCHLIGWQLSRRKRQQAKPNNRNQIPKHRRHVTI